MKYLKYYIKEEKNPTIQILNVNTGEIKEIDFSVFNAGYKDKIITWSAYHNYHSYKEDDLLDYYIEKYSMSPLTNKRFVKFLRDNNAYDKFMYYLEKSDRLKKYWKTIDDFCENLEPDKYLTHAFSWYRKSEEEYDFWNDLNVKWIKLI